MVAGTNSGVGKTTIALGLLAAYQKRGLSVQGFKVGPDYIDPSYHSALTGRPSRNLDSWMLQPDTLREIFLDATVDADLSIVEGVMGLYDGHDALTNTGTTAEIAMLLGIPTVLVVDVESMARSAAAVVLGFMHLEPAVNVCGVIANRVGGPGHFDLVKTAIEDVCKVPVFGYLERADDIELPERHLGLVPAIERGELRPLFDSLVTRMESTIDLDTLFHIASQAPSVAPTETSLVQPVSAENPVHIAVARDAAFNFYYADNLRLLERYGAHITYFSPLAGDKVPDEAQGLYLGGGFPEEFAAELSRGDDVRQNIREHIQSGLPTIAECGGYMYLASNFIDHAGQNHPMAGVIDGTVTMQRRLVGFGYREVTGEPGNVLLPPGERARGHEFHYSTFDVADANAPSAYRILHPARPKGEGVLLPHGVASYTHLHFASNPRMPERFVEACRAFRDNVLTEAKA
ncbi:cobyrinate a,c-diamide synthase [Alicyclobacillus dauci]